VPAVTPVHCSLLASKSTSPPHPTNPEAVFIARSTVNCEPAAALVADGVAVNVIVLDGVKYVKPLKVPVPPGPVTVTFPLIEPDATTATICWSFIRVKLAAATPPNFTAVAPVRLLPLMITLAKLEAEDGTTLEITGVLAKVNPVRVAVTPDTVTVTEPVDPVPTTAVICVAELTVKLAAAVPPKLTALAFVKLVPVIVTDAPAAAVTGVKEVIVGAVAEYVNPASVAVPLAVVTLTEPVVPAPTTAVICVADTTLKLVAAVLPKLTAPAPVRLVPVIVTDAPAPAVAGVKDVIVGAGAE
jgi:hypothetical protein